MFNFGLDQVRIRVWVNQFYYYKWNIYDDDDPIGGISWKHALHACHHTSVRSFMISELSVLKKLRCDLPSRYSFLSKTLKVITSSDQNWLLVMTIHQFTNAVLVTWFRTSQTSQCLLMGTYIYFSALSCSAGWILPCLQDLHSFRSSPLHKKLIPPMHLYAQWGQAEEAEKLLVNLIPSNYYRL